MALNRRQFLIGAGGLAAAATTMGLAACAPGSSGGGSQGGGGGGGTDLALAFWGNPTRNKNTQAEIDAFMKANPDMKIAGQPGEFNTYWDKLATQTAGGNAPDIIQMDMNYISEYGTRGALLDLGKVDVSKFVAGTVDSGKINGKLVGVNAGINSALIFANPKVFEKAKMDLPSDKTWTWDQLMEVGAEVASKAGVSFGLASIMGSDPLFGTFVRQQGKELFTPDGLGFDVADAQAWYELMVKGVKAKAIGTPEQISEEQAKPLDQSAIVVGTAAMQYYNSNQLEAVSAAAGGELMKMLRGPELYRQGKRTQNLVQGEHAVVGVGQDQEPGCRNCVDQLVCERPGGREHRSGGAGHPAEHRDSGRGQAQALSCAAGSREIHRRHQARGGQHPDRPTPRRRHDSQPSCSVTGLMSSSGGRAPLRVRRSSWTR